MKNIVLFIVIFGLGAITFALLNTFILSPKETAVIPTPTATTTTSTDESEDLETEDVPSDDDEVVITADGSLLDGPFIVKDADVKETKATVQIFRSPEETLLQFTNFTEGHSQDADVYLASDLKATSFLSLGFARLNQGVAVYGVPLDADLDNYSYILIYDVRNKATEYSARIR
jgi:hypothetical protein